MGFIDIAENTREFIHEMNWQDNYTYDNSPIFPISPPFYASFSLPMFKKVTIHVQNNKS